MRPSVNPNTTPAAAAVLAGGYAPHRTLALPFADSVDARALQTAVLPWLTHFGLDSVSYFVTTHTDDVVNGEMVWTTLPPAWSACYRREAHVALDPRLTPTRRHLAAFVWDARECAADWRLRRFVADAHLHGIAGGVVISLYDGPTRWVTVSFDVGIERADASLRDRMAPHAGNLLALSIALRGCIVMWPQAHAPSQREHRGLSFRERNCLSLAARGLTSADIGERLCVAERTVNFHFRNIKTKLGAINRSEAIARGISLGILGADGSQLP